MERKWTEIKYHVQDNSEVELKDVKMYFNTNKLPALPFCGPHSKPHCARGLSTHYHFRFDQKLGNGLCAVLRIPCDCVACTAMLYKSCIYSIPSYEKERYKPVTKCNYWTVLGSFNNWNIIIVSQKSNTSDAFDEIHQVFLGVISDNMSLLVESGNYGSINTIGTENNGIYVIIFTSEAYTLQDNTTIYGKIITAG